MTGVSPIEDLRQMRRQHGIVLVAAVLFTLGSMLLLVAAFVYSWVNPSPPALLGPYPQQTVNLPRETIDVAGDPMSVPVLDFPDTAAVPVTAEKCVKAEGGVAVTGFAAWKPVHPNDAALVTSEGSTTRSFGCTTEDFANRVPPAVQRYIAALHVEGVDVSLWKITGTETPTEPTGLPHTWETEVFAIRYGGPG